MEKPDEAVDEITPRTALELASTIAAFAKSLSDDQGLVCSAIMIAFQAVQSDQLAALKSRR
jgi:hypothetical protein